MSFLARWQDLVLPVALISSLLVILVPLPSWVLDILLAGNITISVIILLTTVFVKTPMEFSIFPSVLLATTLARLVLNVASTRLILNKADSEGMEAAGGVIKAFGEFVAGDKLVVGIVIFVIIVIIQFVVITKGATRISEVAARFALDGMPGRQMAIDADLNAGLIDEREAQRRRAEVTSQADFYGAMDGASKFVRGDAIAGIVITMINLIGGFAIGILQLGMTAGEAAEVFAKLSIGDGLVSQVPAFLISLAAGLLTTRSTQSANLPVQFLQQMFSHPRSLAVAAGFLSILVLTNLPKVPLLTLAGGCGGLALMLSRSNKREEQAVQRAQKQEQDSQEKPKEEPEKFLPIDPMELEVGAALIRLAHPKFGGDLVDRITKVRQSVASDIGIILPGVRIRDNISRLNENEYRIKISNNPVAAGTVYPGKLMAINSGGASGDLPGIAGRDPAFDQPAVWIESGLRDRAALAGYSPIEPSAVMATHLQEVVRKHADELLTRDATRKLIDNLKKETPAVVDELIPGILKLAEVQAVLQMLLREEVPIRQLGLILETLGDYASRTKDPVLLTEYVRTRLGRTLCSRYRDKESRLHVITLNPSLEDRIAGGTDHNDRGIFSRLHPNTVDALCQNISNEVAKLARAGRPQIVLVSPQIRPGLRLVTQNNLPRLKVMSYSEVTRDTKVEVLGVVADVPEQR